MSVVVWSQLWIQSFCMQPSTTCVELPHRTLALKIALDTEASPQSARDMWGSESVKVYGRRSGGTPCRDKRATVTDAVTATILHGHRLTVQTMHWPRTDQWPWLTVNDQSQHSLAEPVTGIRNTDDDEARSRDNDIHSLSTDHWDQPRQTGHDQPASAEKQKEGGWQVPIFVSQLQISD